MAKAGFRPREASCQAASKVRPSRWVNWMGKDKISSPGCLITRIWLEITPIEAILVSAGGAGTGCCIFNDS